MGSKAATQDSDREGFYFGVGRRDPVQLGFVWRVWTRGSSFYMKPRWNVLGAAKVSLHGREEGKGEPGFKLGLDRSASKAAAPAVITPAEFLPVWFPGKFEGHDLTHVVRVCVPWDTFTPGSPFGPGAGEVGPRFTAGLIPPPPAGKHSIVDLYVSNSYPQFPLKKRMHQQNAMVGQLRNSAGQYLIGISRQLSMTKVVIPEHTEAPPPSVAADRVRGIGAGLDPSGYVWLVERVMSRKWLARTREEPAAAEDTCA